MRAALPKCECLWAKLDSAVCEGTVFRNNGINITTDVVCGLGTPILAYDYYLSATVTCQVNRWKEELSELAEIAAVQPHLAFRALTKGPASWWTSLSRTAEDIGPQPLEDLIQKEMLPAITGRSAPNLATRSLFQHAWETS